MLGRFPEDDQSIVIETSVFLTTGCSQSQQLLQLLRIDAVYMVLPQTLHISKYEQHNCVVFSTPGFALK